MCVALAFAPWVFHIPDSASVYPTVVISAFIVVVISNLPGLLSALLCGKEEPCTRRFAEFVRPLCQPVGDLQSRALQSSIGFVVGDVAH